MSDTRRCSGIPHDLIPGLGQGQGHRGPKVVKVADFKGHLLC